MGVLLRSTIKLFLLCLFLTGGDHALGQADTEQTENAFESNSKREEIQRYMGYELLLYRYFSLPYDVSLNVNQQGNYVDIGLIFILFFPLILLINVSRKKLLAFLSVVYLTFTWIISTSNSFIFSPSKYKIHSASEAVSNYLETVPFSSEPLSQMVAFIYKLSLVMYQPLLSLGQAISGDKDYVTYPIFFGLFIILSLFILKYLNEKKGVHKYFLVFFWLYTFFWLTFGGGIIWYGNILLLIGLFVMYLSINNIVEQKPKIGQLLKNGFIGFGIFWILIATVLRISSIQPHQTQENLGKGLYNPIFFEYGVGKITKGESVSMIYGDLNKALDLINKEKKSLIWRVGTSFSYFIENNDKRIVIDNQMGYFHALRRHYPNNTELIRVFKSNNVKYLLIDLNTATIDNTPQKSLTQKYRELLFFVINNPRLKLLATDRVVGNKDKNGKMVYSRDINGEIIHMFGRYAIYEIN